ncbi:hypothetical protein THAOC_28762, partial [Thalassiosira oceanica]
QGDAKIVASQSLAKEEIKDGLEAKLLCTEFTGVSQRTQRSLAKETQEAQRRVSARQESSRMEKSTLQTL